MSKDIKDEIIIGFLCGIEFDLLKKDEVIHRVAGFRHTKSYREAQKLINSEALDD